MKGLVQLPIMTLAMFAQLAGSPLSAADARKGFDRARDYAVYGGLGPIKEGEVRVWSAQVTCSGGVSLAGSELIEYRGCYRIPSQYEVHNNMQWIRSSLPAGKVEEVRNAVAGIVDLDGQHLLCDQGTLDGGTTLIEAMVKGIHVFLEAEEPHEGTTDACQRIANLETLLWEAARNRTEQGR